MSSVDNRIVNMEFNNKQFTAGVTETQRSLQGLEKTLAGAGGTKGLESMGSAVDGVHTKFGALQVMGVSALATIASKATSFGLDMIKSFTLDPLKAGFDEYETNLKSTQTIMANTGESVKVTGQYLAELNKYSDQTIYNFSQMADSIGKFTAAGVSLPKATDAIKGMANTAALSGANTQQLNSAMYQMSQALASGTIKLMDWNSLVNANMGGQNVQKALQATAHSIEGLGAPMDAAIKKNGTFRDSLSEGWLNSEIFTKTMKVMAGTTLTAADTAGKTAKELRALGYAGKDVGDTVAFTVEELKKMGYADAAAKELHRLSGAAIESATKIKSFTQLIDVVKESIGSGFGKVFENLFGNLKEAGNLWTNVGDRVTGAVGVIFDAVNGVLGQWKELGGYTALWNAFGNIFQTIGNLLHPFVAAFQAILPTTGNAGEGLANMSKGFESATAWMEKASRGAEVLTPILVAIATGIKSAFGYIGDGIGLLKPVIDYISGVIGDLKGALSGLSMTDINFDALGAGAKAAFDKLKEAVGSISFDEFKMAVTNTVSAVVKAVGKMRNALSNLSMSDINLSNIISFSGDFGKEAYNMAADIVGGITEGLFGVSTADLKAAISGVATKVIDGFKSAFGIASPAKEMIPIGKFLIEGLIEGLQAGAQMIFGAIAGMGKWIIEGWRQLFGGMDALQIAALMNSLFSGAMILAITNAVNSVGSMVDGFASIGDSLNKTLGAMQQAIKAQAIKDIAIAIALLGGSLIILGMIKVDQVKQGIGAVGVLMAMMVSSMALLSKMGGGFSVSKKGLEGGATDIILMATAMEIVALAMVTLAGAVAILGAMDPAAVEQGLTTMGVALVMMVGAVLFFSKIGPLAEGAAGSILVMATAMIVLSGAVKAFGAMNRDELEQGLGAIALALSGLILAVLAFSKMSAQAAVAGQTIVMLSAALVILAFAVQKFGEMDYEVLKQGLIGMAYALGILIIGLLILSNFAGQAAIAGGSLLLLAIAVNLLASAVIKLGEADPDAVSAGLKALAIALGILLIAGALAYAVSAGLLVLGVAVLALGVGLFAAGAGMLLFATGLALLVSVGAAGIVLMSAAVTAFLALLPVFAMQLAASFVTFLQTLALAAPKIREAVGTIITNLLGAVRDAIPEFGKVASKFIETFLKVLEKAIPQVAKVAKEYMKALFSIIRGAIPEYGKILNKLIDTGLTVLEKAVPRVARAAVRIITSLLDEIAKGVPKMARSATKLMIAFMEAIATESVKLADAAAKALIKFLNGLATAIENNDEKLRTAGFNIAMAIANGITGGLAGRGLEMVKEAATQLADALPGWMKKVLGINSPAKVMIPLGEAVGEGMAVGIGLSTARVMKATVAMADAVIKTGYESIANLERELERLESAATTADKRAEIAQQLAKFDERYQKQKERDAERARKDADKAKEDAEKAEERAKKARKENADNAERLKRLAEKQAEAAKQQDRAADRQEKAAKAQAKAAKASQKAADQALKAAERAEELAQKQRDKVQRAKDFQAADPWTQVDMLQEDLAGLRKSQSESYTSAKLFAASAERNRQRARDAETKAQKKYYRGIAKNMQDQADKAKAAADAMTPLIEGAVKAVSGAILKAIVYAARLLEDRAVSINMQRAAFKEQMRLDQEYEDADVYTKASIMEARAKKSQELADEQDKLADEQIAAAQAVLDKLERDAYAGTVGNDDDGIKRQIEEANKQMDEAEAMAKLAQDNATRAKQERDSAKDLRKQIADEEAQARQEAEDEKKRLEDEEREREERAKQNTNLTPSKSALEDAAKVIDRYSESLLQAQEAALAGQKTIQFVQNNNSPESLTASEIYRQTKNLISAQEFKMGANT